MDHLPVELLVSIFRSLSYSALISILRTSRRWREAVLNDIRLCHILFLRPTDHYIPDDSDVLSPGSRSSVSLRSHPVFDVLRYQFGNASETAGFIGHNAEMQFIHERRVFKSFAFIPSVNAVEVCIPTDQGYKSTLPALKIPISNPSGVTVEDVISTLSKETRRKVDLISYITSGAFSQRLYGGQRLGLAMVADILPKPRRCFSGFTNLQRNGSSATVHVQLASSST